MVESSSFEGHKILVWNPMDPFIPLIAKWKVRNEMYSRNDILSNAGIYQWLTLVVAF